MFNSSYEFSLRLLLILNRYKDIKLSSERITYIDFITVHGAVFNPSSVNLHGENRFRFCEITSRGEIVQDALRLLAFKNLINIASTNTGFLYSISESGASYSKALKSNYANKFRENLENTYFFIENISDKRLFNIINKHSLESIK